MEESETINGGSSTLFYTQSVQYYTNLCLNCFVKNTELHALTRSVAVAAKATKLGQTQTSWLSLVHTSQKNIPNILFLYKICIKLQTFHLSVTLDTSLNVENSKVGTLPQITVPG
jgi:hypothetical protein